MILSIFTSIYIVISTIGFFIARWTIKQYNKVPHYNYDNNTQKVIYSSRALNQLDSSSSNNTPTNELFQNNNDANNNQEQDSKLQTRLPQYSGINPFTIKKLSNYEKFKIYLFCISGIALIRMILFFGCAVGLYLISLPITICFSPNSFMHTQLVRFIRYFIGCALFLFGFYYIDFSDQTGLSSNKNKEKDEDEPIRVIVANHSTVFDGMVILWRTNGIIAAKKEISKAPIFGRILNALQTLWIDRSGSKGRNYAKQQIINHVNDHKAPPLIIFPQGTCSNVHTVTSFKAGAYLAKQKVLEISLNWSKNKSCDLSFVSDVHPMAHLIHVGCCQFVNYCHVDIHHIHSPSIDEQHDVALFAENSRKYVLRSLNKYNHDPKQPIIGTKHSYSDWRLLHKAYKANPNFITTDTLMDDIISTLCLRTKTVSYLAEIFGKLDENKTGYIEYDEFCTAFGRDPNEKSKQLRNFFNVFNTDNKAQSFGRIDFNEFLVGVATCFMDDKIEDALKIMFHANEDENDLKYILKDNILATYQRNIDKTKIKNEKDEGNYEQWLKKMKLFVNQVFNNKDRLTFDEFVESVESNQYQYMVQHYLQSIITMRLKIKLSNKDFTMNDNNNKIYVNPLSELVRSSSIRSVVQS